MALMPIRYLMRIPIGRNKLTSQTSISALQTRIDGSDVTGLEETEVVKNMKIFDWSPEKGIQFWSWGWLRSCTLTGLQDNYSRIWVKETHWWQKCIICTRIPNENPGESPQTARWEKKRARRDLLVLVQEGLWLLGSIRY